MTKLTTTVIDPTSPLIHPIQLVKEICIDFFRSRELASRLLERDIRSKYRQSALGMTWIILTPLTSALVFIFLQSEGVLTSVPSGGIPYALFVFLGTYLWQVFVDSINAPLKVLDQNRSMLGKINFPRESLIIVAFGSVIFDTVVKSILMGGIILFFRPHLHWSLLLAPLAVVAIILHGITLGLLLTPLGALYRDVSTMIASLAGFWFFVTPVVYEPTKSGIISKFTLFNPIAHLLTGTRDLVLSGAITSPVAFAIVIMISIVGFIFAALLFRVSMPVLIERMGS